MPIPGVVDSRNIISVGGASFPTISTKTESKEQKLAHVRPDEPIGMSDFSMMNPLGTTVPKTSTTKMHGGVRSSLRKRWLDVEKIKIAKRETLKYSTQVIL